MKRHSFLRVVFVLLFLTLVLCGLCSCSENTTSGEKDEILGYFRDKMTGTSPASSDMVYWTKNGSVYHLFADCRFLEDSDEVYHGSIAQSGRSRLCSDCEKKSELTSQDTAVTTVAEEMTDESVRVTSGPTDTFPPPSQSTSIPSKDTSPITKPSDTDHAGNKFPSVTDSGTSATDNGDSIPHIVYWTPNGSVWHADANCPSLARSKVVKSGTVDQSGKARGCKKCTFSQ